MNLKLLRNSVLIGLLGCYFVLICVHTGSILSIITSDDVAALCEPSKLIQFFLFLCWCSGIFLFGSSLFRTFYAVKYYWEWRCYHDLLHVIRYSTLNFCLFVFPDLILRYGPYAHKIVPNSSLCLIIAVIGVFLAWSRYCGLDYEEITACA